MSVHSSNLTAFGKALYGKAEVGRDGQCQSFSPLEERECMSPQLTVTSAAAFIYDNSPAEVLYIQVGEVLCHRQCTEPCAQSSFCPITGVCKGGCTHIHTDTYVYVYIYTHIHTKLTFIKFRPVQKLSEAFPASSWRPRVG